MCPSGSGSGTPVTPILTPLAVTLGRLEQEVARRVGPYYADAASGGASNPATLVCLNLASSIDLGGYEDLWLLRRGKTSAGAPIVGFNTGDRQRRVKEYDPASGTLSLDRAYSAAPIAGEAFELHHLDPANELRPAVLAGLARCFFVDRSPVTLLTSAAERNLTLVAPWITSVEQVLGAAYTYDGSAERPVPVGWRRVFSAGGAVWLSLASDPAPATLLITSRRSYDTLVNGATSTTGPLLDDDVLAVDLRYGAAAGHIEAWRLWRDRLQDASAEGRRLTMEGAAAEFSGQAQRWYRPPPPSVEFDEPFGSGAGRGFTGDLGALV